MGTILADPSELENVSLEHPQVAAIFAEGVVHQDVMKVTQELEKLILAQVPTGTYIELIPLGTASGKWVLRQVTQTDITLHSYHMGLGTQRVLNRWIEDLDFGLVYVVPAAATKKTIHIPDITELIIQHLNQRNVTLCETHNPNTTNLPLTNYQVILDMITTPITPADIRNLSIAFYSREPSVTLQAASLFVRAARETQTDLHHLQQRLVTQFEIDSWITVKHVKGGGYTPQKLPPVCKTMMQQRVVYYTERMLEAFQQALIKEF